MTQITVSRAYVMVEQIIAAAMDCIRHDVAPDWQRAALRNKLSAILAANPASQPEPPAADERATWDNARESLAVVMAGFASRSGSRDFNAAISVLDAITEPGLPLSWLRTARASPADERAAFPRYTEWLHLRTHGEWSNGVPAWARDHTGRMNDFTAATAVIEELAEARAASSTETVTERVRRVGAWRTEDGRVISAEQKAGMLSDGGAGASSVAPYSIPCWLDDDRA